MTEFQVKINIISIFRICEIENQTSEESKGDLYSGLLYPQLKVEEKKISKWRYQKIQIRFSEFWHSLLQKQPNFQFLLKFGVKIGEFSKNSFNIPCVRSREQSVSRFLGKFVPVRRFSWNVLENLFKSHQEMFLFQVLLIQ